jgi:DNA-binding XRE family transcriptional regulator
MMTQPIYNRLTLFRTEAAMSRRELAEKVGVNPQTIGCLERGDYSPSLELAMRVARLFEVPVEALFSFEPFEPVAVLIQRAREMQK